MIPRPLPSRYLIMEWQPGSVTFTTTAPLTPKDRIELLIHTAEKQAFWRAETDFGASEARRNGGGSGGR